MSDISSWTRVVHALAVWKGWWEGYLPNPTTEQVITKLALVITELSEAIEQVRDGQLEVCSRPDKFGQDKPEGLPVELADAVIRIMDLCGALGIDLEEVIRLKHEFNRGRQHRHGGRLA